MEAQMFQEIEESLRCLYLEDSRPWLVGFSGGKYSTMLALLTFEVVPEIPTKERFCCSS
jgi:DNA sulfur modification protein DndC